MLIHALVEIKLKEIRKRGKKREIAKNCFTVNDSNTSTNDCLYKQKSNITNILLTIVFMHKNIK